MSPGITWTFCPAEDTSVDSEHCLLVNGHDVGISVQDARGYGGGYIVHRYTGEGDEFASHYHGTFSTLRMAKAVGFRVFRTGR